MFFRSLKCGRWPCVVHLQIALIHSYCATYPFRINLVLLAIKNDYLLQSRLGEILASHIRLGKGYPFLFLFLFLPLVNNLHWFVTSINNPSVPAFFLLFFFFEALPFVQSQNEKKKNIRWMFVSF